MDDIDWKEKEVNAMATIRICLADDMMYGVMDEESLIEICPIR